MCKARAAVMLVWAWREQGAWERALMSAVAAKVELEHAMGTVETEEFASVLHLQATAASALGQHEAAAHLLLHASKLVSRVSPLLSRRMRHLGGSELAHGGKFDDAAQELRQLTYELQRDPSVEPASVSLASSNVARAFLLDGKVTEAVPLLQDAVVALNSQLGRAHRFSRQVERLWAICELEPRPPTWRQSLLTELKETLPV